VLSTLWPKPPGRSPAPSWGVAPPPLAFRLVYTASGACLLLPLSHFPKKILRFHSGLRLIEVSLVSRRSLSSTTQSCHGNRVAQSAKWALQPVDNGDIGDNRTGIADRRPAGRFARDAVPVRRAYRCGKRGFRGWKARMRNGGRHRCRPPRCRTRRARPKGRPPALRRFGASAPKSIGHRFGSIRKSRSACALALVSRRLLRRPSRRFQPQIPKENRRPHRPCG